MSNPLRRWADSFFHVYQKTDLTSWEHAPQDTRPIYGVYHVYCATDWQGLVFAQLEALRKSGLLAATRKLYVSIIAPSEEDVEAFLQKHAPQDRVMTPKAGTPKPNEPAAHITTRFLSKQLQPDVVAVNLATLPPYGDDMRGWKYETHFAYANEDGELTCIFRNAGSKKYGFCALDYQTTPGGQWSTMIGSWHPVNGSLERSAAPCYRMRASRRYLDNTPDVTIEFVNRRL